MMQEQVHIVEEDRREPETETVESLYEDAKVIERELYVEYDWRLERFVDAVLDEVEVKDVSTDNFRLIDEIEESEDVDLGVLFALPDESLFFVGSDPTARDSVPLFGFFVERSQPIPAPRTAEDALDLLKPEDIKQAFSEDRELSRQGEWWLLPTKKVPVGTTFRPGVNERPFGASPLDNHVPREYGFMVSDQEFVEGMREICDVIPSSMDSPPELIDWIWRQHNKNPVPEYAPDWTDIRDVSGGVLVRGTLRHRENDHYVENVGEDWHEAQTHDMDVYTGDDLIDRVRID